MSTQPLVNVETVNSGVSLPNHVKIVCNKPKIFVAAMPIPILMLTYNVVSMIAKK
jgi:hypothetical protein